jgi:hypothetical protein
MEMELPTWRDKHRLCDVPQCPSGQGRASGADLQNQDFGRVMSTQRAPEHSDPVGLIKQRRRVFEGQGGLPVRAGQRWADAWARKRRLKAVVVWTDDGCPFACAGAVVTLVLARLAS